MRPSELTASYQNLSYCSAKIEAMAGLRLVEQNGWELALAGLWMEKANRNLVFQYLTATSEQPTETE